ncbi:MAG: hydroxymethylglutaryl-CoA reductase, degradative [Candidatus Aenigmatarchaeota archaeon]
MDSGISGFYKLPPKKRREVLKKRIGLSEEEMERLEEFGALKEETANDLIENVFTNYPLPLGIATNLQVNGKDYLVPMAVEESSVVAACSYAAKLARGNVEAEADEPIMIGQIELNGVKNFEEIEEKIMENKDKIISRANSRDSTIIKLGGGAKDLEVRNIPKKDSCVVHLLVNVKDAMGANIVNSMCEDVAPLIEKITNSEVNLRILSNLADRRKTRAEVTIPFDKLEKDKLSGEDVAAGIVDAYEFAAADPYRAATHNKGVMNGMDAVCIATGNDFRALETGVHSHAAKSGSYEPVTEWWIEDGNLKGRIEVPIAVGTVGGITSIHPLAKINLKILDVESAQELAKVMASVGLLQNFAALRALATEGIQKGHMKLHAKNIAKQAGAKGDEIERIAETMIEEGNISQSRAEKIINKKE